MTGHIADLVSRQDLRDVAEERIRELTLSLDIIGDFDPYMYVPPGPVAQAFLNSQALTNIIMGPLGGGKTTACMFKRVMIAGMGPIAWHPRTKKPTRMCRAIVLRDTFRQTEKTVLASWQKSFPKGYPGSSSQGGNDRPFLQTLQFMGSDGVRVEAITEFAGLGEQAIGEMLKGSEYSVGWLNEVDTHAEGALDDLEGRLGRYPSADILLSPRELEALERELGHKLQVPRDELGQQGTMRMLIGDMNAPTLDSWTYPTLVTDLGPDRKFFEQPGGLDEDAENIFALPGGRDYYQRIVDNHEDRYVQRMVHNKFGYSLAGKPVYQNWDHKKHVAAAPIPFRPNLDLHIGIDVSTNGLSPAAIFGQVTTRLNFIDELWADQGVGAARFGELLRLHLAEHYPNLDRRRIKLWCDPASEFGGDKEAGELNALEQISQAIKVPARVPGNGSNAISLRLTAMETEFRGYLAPDTSLLVSPKCPLYLQTAGGKYRYKRKPAGSSNEYEDTPEKSHPWSDLADAGQYLVIGVRGHAGVMRAANGGAAGGGGKGGTRWSSQDGETQSTSWKSQGGFDPHKAGVK